MSPIILVALSALMALYVCHVQGQSSCATPSGAVGSCISLYNCSELMTLFSKPNKSQQDLQLLKQSHCGFDRNVPKVCCPVQSTTTTESLLHQGKKENDSCFTPDGQQGRCVGIYSCQHLADMLTPPVSNYTVVFLQKLRCSGQEPYSVCCTLPPTPPPVPVVSQVCTITAALQDPNSRCCGQSPSDKIIRGPVTEIDQYPWLALIVYSSNDEIKLLCTGSLISGRYVLTAGHCVRGIVLEVGTPKNVRLGEYDTTNDGMDCVEAPGGGRDCTDGVTVIPIETIIVHPEYDPSTRRNDIAMLRLKELAPYTDFIRPICLPTTDVTVSPPPHIYLTVAGWGAVVNEYGIRNSTEKMDVHLPFVPEAECQAAFRRRGLNVTLWQGQVCAGGDGKDFCSGNTGGPLVYENGGHFEIVGINNFGPSVCMKKNTPSVYTKVFKYNSWIRGLIV